MVAHDSSRETDVIVVGAGPGGYVAAIRAAQLGLDTTLIDRDGYGGTCLNRGCIPSKALLSATDRVDAVTGVEEMGIYADPYVELAELVAWKDGIVDRLTSGVEHLCTTNGVKFARGTASFVDASTAIVDGPETRTKIDFEHAIVATGSRPISLPGFDYTDSAVLDARQALSLDATPDRLVVVGAGYIGLELATVFAKLGTAVTVVEMLDDVLPGFDADLGRPVRKQLSNLGVEFHFGWRAIEWTEDSQGTTVVIEDDEGNQQSHECDYVLVAVGREPVSDTISLENLGIATDDRGFIPTDDVGRTDLEHVFAVGDVAGEPMLAHEASHAGLVAAETIANIGPSNVNQPVPAVVFTDPEIAVVGLNPTEASDQGHDITVGEFPFAASGRALTTGHDEGFVRIIGDCDSGAVLGCQVVGPEASELVAEVGVAIATGATLADLASTIHAHPTLSEAVMEAAANALGRSVHRPNE